MTLSNRNSVLITVLIVPCLGLIDPSMFRRSFHPETPVQGGLDDSSLFVFPSMQMSGSIAKSSDDLWAQESGERKTKVLSITTTDRSKLRPNRKKLSKHKKINVVLVIKKQHVQLGIHVMLMPNNANQNVVVHFMTLIVVDYHLYVSRRILAHITLVIH